MKALCQICHEELKAPGVWALHWMARDHRREKHPEAFAAMEREEQEIADKIQALVIRYGAAARRRF